MPTKSCLIAIVLVLLACLCPVFNAVAKIDLVTLADRNAVQTTIYNKADLTLVRDQRVVNFVKGMNQLQFSWANTSIDPTSLYLEIKKQNSVLDVVEITYPSGTKDVGIWQVNAKQACQVPVEITYFTSGISWTSYYRVLLSKDQNTCDIRGYVTVTNRSGEDYQNAMTRLVVGKVNILDTIARLASRQYPYDRPDQADDKMELKNTYQKGMQALERAQPVMAMASPAKRSRPKDIKKQGLSEYFLYTIEGRETIAHGWSKRLLSFKADGIKVKNIYKYDPERFGKKVVRFLTFKNDKANNLGQTPLPGGEMNVFQRIGKPGELDFVGSDTSRYIPVSTAVELDLGPAPAIKIIPRIMAFTKQNLVFDKKGNLSGFDEVKTFKIQFSNFTDTPSSLEYVKTMDSAHFEISDITDKDRFEQIDQDTIKFTIELLPHATQTIGFTLTTRRGERRWQQ